jgi:hypothetical protein
MNNSINFKLVSGALLLAAINSIIITLLLIGIFILEFNIWGKIVEPNLGLAIFSLVVLGILFGLILWRQRVKLKEKIISAPIYILGIIEVIVVATYIWGISNQNISSLYYYTMFIIPLSLFALIVKRNIHVWGLFIVHFLITIWVISSILK